MGIESNKSLLKNVEQRLSINLDREKLQKALLRSFVLFPYRVARRVGDRFIKADFTDYFTSDVQNINNILQRYNSLLDIGSGYGYLGEALQKLTPETIVVNSDVVNNQQGNTKFVIADGIALPFADNSFDVITLFYVLHHSEKFRDILQEAKRVSRSKILVQEDVPNNTFERLVSWLHIYTWQPDKPFSDIKTRNDQEWQDFFKEEGFKIKNKRPIHIPGLPITRYEYLLE